MTRSAERERREVRYITRVNPDRFERKACLTDRKVALAMSEPPQINRGVTLAPGVGVVLRWWRVDTQTGK